MNVVTILQPVINKNENAFFSSGFGDIASFVLAIVGLITLIFGLIQYRKSLLIKRSDQFLKMRERYVDNIEFQNLFTLLETDSEKLKAIPYKIKYKLLGFYEEIALMTNSKLLKEEVSFYMFAYNAVRIWKSKNFWILTDIDNKESRIDKDSKYWALFNDFAQRMSNYEKHFSFNKAKFKL